MGTITHPTETQVTPLAMLSINFIGRSESFLQVIDTIQHISDYDVTVSIYGETGTGKELVARALHYQSSRAAGPFVPVNCGAIPDTLLESQLFGHKSGAFTDAKKDREGFIEQATGGTLFLDEVEALTPKAQVTLLRFLQDMTYQRVGGTKLHEADVRVVVASNVELDELCRSDGAFREDLFYRLDLLSIRLPPLRERVDDIPLLAKHFLEKFGIKYELEEKYLSTATLHWLTSRDWPGNVRELENSIHRGLLMAEGNEILPTHLRSRSASLSDRPPSTSTNDFKAAKTRSIEQFEHDYLTTMLSRCSGNISASAQHANVDRSTLGRLLKKYRIDHRDFLSR